MQFPLTHSFLQVIDVINATTNDLGPLSVDFFRKDKLSASWKVVGHKTTADNATSAEVSLNICSYTKWAKCIVNKYPNLISFFL